MKKKKFEKRLVLRKDTITKLSAFEMNAAIGGETQADSCLVTCPNMTCWKTCVSGTVGTCIATCDTLNTCTPGCTTYTCG